MFKLSISHKWNVQFTFTVTTQASAKGGILAMRTFIRDTMFHQCVKRGQATIEQKITFLFPYEGSIPSLNVELEAPNSAFIS